jgi:uncharacterized membrane protein YhhN
MDRQILGRRSRAFDAPQPWWVRYAFAVTLPFTLAMLFAINEGRRWWLLAAVLVVPWLGIFLAVMHWSRAHYVPRDKRP